MTTQAPTLFDLPPVLPEVGTYVALGGSSSKILRYNDAKTEVVVEQWIQGEKQERRFDVKYLNPAPLPAEAPGVARQAFGVVIEAPTADEVTATVQRLKAAMAQEGIAIEEVEPPAGIPVRDIIEELEQKYEARPPIRHTNEYMIRQMLAEPQQPLMEWEIKILRQQIAGGDLDHHENMLAELLNDGWEIMQMLSCPVDGRSPSMLVAIYLRRPKPASFVPPTPEKVETVENVPSPTPAPEPTPEPAPVPVPPEEPLPAIDDDPLPDTQPLILPRLDDAPPATFAAALALHETGHMSTEELLEFGNRQALNAGLNTFIDLSIERQRSMQYLNLPMLPLPESPGAA